MEGIDLVYIRSPLLVSEDVSGRDLVSLSPEKILRLRQTNTNH